MASYLLLGGTGAIGTYLVKELLKNQNNKVYITSRKKHISEERLFFLEGDAHDVLFLENVITVCTPIDVIVDFMVWTTKEFENIYNVLLANCHKYIYMSSSRVFASTTGKLSEKSPRLMDVTNDEKFLENDSYAVPKTQQEDILRKSNYNNYVILRPYITYSEKRLPLGNQEKELWLYRILHNRTIVFPLDIGQHLTALTHGDDCAKAIYNIITKKEVENEINISTNESITWMSILDIYKKILTDYGYEVKVKYIQASIKAKYGDYQTKYDRLVDRVFDTSELEKYVNIYDFKSIEKGIAEALTNFLYSKSFNMELQSWALQAEMDALTGERASISEFSKKKDYLKYILCRYLPLSKIKKLFKH